MRYIMITAQTGWRSPACARRPRRRGRLLTVAFSGVLLAACWLLPPVAEAMPQAPALVCETYPDAAVCAGQVPACTLCHTSPPARNAFGDSVAAQLAVGTPRPLDPATFSAELPLALMLVEGSDADSDGFSNLDEILNGSLPADPASKPSDLDVPDCVSGDDVLAADAAAADAAWEYNVCEPDPQYTYRKLVRQFCGYSPSFDDVNALAALSDPWPRIHEALDGCLRSDYWRGEDGVLWQLANRKITPAASLKAGADAGSIPLGDYEDDYNLFVYTQTDHRDARELLTAQYMVSRTGSEPTVYEAYTRSPLADVQLRGVTGSQLVVPERRAGMLTTRWFLVTNTMFSAMPRTTAAQAYRAYLGMDIAKLEGLLPVSDEPVDYDVKGVTKAECAVCHSTLDPLTYPFTRYEGLGAGLATASYQPGRMDRFVSELTPDIAATPEAGVVLGQPVEDLLAWAEVAANSDEFARATALDYWRLLFGEGPRPDEADVFESLWRSLRAEHEYSIDRMLHDLIETEAYSVP